VWLKWFLVLFTVAEQISDWSEAKEWFDNETQRQSWTSCCWADHLSCIFSKMGTIMSNLGLLAGSSFMQSLISLQMWGEIPGGMVGRRPSRATWAMREIEYRKPRNPFTYGCCALGTGLSSHCGLVDRRGKYDALLTFMPISMCERSAKGTSRVTSSHSNTAKLHMSADLLLMSSGLFCSAENKRERKNSINIMSWECIRDYIMFRTGWLITLRSCYVSRRKGVQKNNRGKTLYKYLQEPSRLESTCDQDTGRRTWHPPCLFWLSCPHQSENQTTLTCYS